MADTGEPNFSAPVEYGPSSAMRRGAVIEPPMATVMGKTGKVFEAKLSPWDRVTISGPSSKGLVGLFEIVGFGLCNGPDPNNEHPVLVPFMTNVGTDEYGLPVEGAPEEGDDTQLLDQNGTGNTIMTGLINPPATRQVPWTTDVVAGPGLGKTDYGKFPYNGKAAPGAKSHAVKKPRLSILLGAGLYFSDVPNALQDGGGNVPAGQISTDPKDTTHPGKYITIDLANTGGTLSGGIVDNQGDDKNGLAVNVDNRTVKIINNKLVVVGLTGQYGSDSTVSGVYMAGPGIEIIDTFISGNSESIIEVELATVGGSIQAGLCDSGGDDANGLMVNLAGSGVTGSGFGAVAPRRPQFGAYPSFMPEQYRPVYDDGHLAFIGGLDLAQNPHPTGSEAVWWSMGWNAGAEGRRYKLFGTTGSGGSGGSSGGIGNCSGLLYGSGLTIVAGGGNGMAVWLAQQNGANNSGLVFGGDDGQGLSVSLGCGLMLDNAGNIALDIADNTYGSGGGSGGMGLICGVGMDGNGVGVDVDNKTIVINSSGQIEAHGVLDPILYHAGAGLLLDDTSNVFSIKLCDVSGLSLTDCLAANPDNTTIVINSQNQLQAVGLNGSSQACSPGSSTPGGGDGSKQPIPGPGPVPVSPPIAPPIGSAPISTSSRQSGYNCFSGDPSSPLSVTGGGTAYFAGAWTIGSGHWLQCRVAINGSFARVGLDAGFFAGLHYNINGLVWNGSIWQGYQTNVVTASSPIQPGPTCYVAIIDGSCDPADPNPGNYVVLIGSTSYEFWEVHEQGPTAGDFPYDLNITIDLDTGSSAAVSEGLAATGIPAGVTVHWLDGTTTTGTGAPNTAVPTSYTSYWQAGWDAYVAGTPETPCPYVADPDANKCKYWTQGWIDAHNAFLPSEPLPGGSWPITGHPSPPPAPSSIPADYQQFWTQGYQQQQDGEPQSSNPYYTAFICANIEPLDCNQAAALWNEGWVDSWNAIYGTTGHLLPGGSGVGQGGPTDGNNSTVATAPANGAPNGTVTKTNSNGTTTTVVTTGATQNPDGTWSGGITTTTTTKTGTVLNPASGDGTCTTAPIPISGTINTAGNLNVGGNVTITGTLDVNGLATFNAGIVVNGMTTTTNLTVSSNATIGGDLSVTGNISAAGLTVSALTTTHALKIGGLTSGVLVSSSAGVVSSLAPATAEDPTNSHEFLTAHLGVIGWQELVFVSSIAPNAGTGISGPVKITPGAGITVAIDPTDATAIQIGIDAGTGGGTGGGVVTSLNTLSGGLTLAVTGNATISESGATITIDAPAVTSLTDDATTTVRGDVIVHASRNITAVLDGTTKVLTLDVPIIGYTGGSLVVSGDLHVAGNQVFDLIPQPNTGAMNLVLTQAANASALPAGTYDYVYTRLGAGGETTIGNDISITVTTGNTPHVAFPNDATPGVTGRKLYRTPVGTPGNYKLVGTITTAAAFNYVDVIPDGSLGVAPPIVNTARGSLTIADTTYNGHFATGLSGTQTTPDGYISVVVSGTQRWIPYVTNAYTPSGLAGTGLFEGVGTVLTGNIELIPASNVTITESVPGNSFTFGLGPNVVINPMTSTGDLIAALSSTTDFALGKAVTESSHFLQSVGSFVVDGDDGTPWKGGLTAPGDWVYIDLVSPVSISSARVYQTNANWQQGFTTGFKVQSSNDASTWVDAYTETNALQDETVSFTPVSARYWRLLITALNSDRCHIGTFALHASTGTPGRIPIGSNGQVLTVVNSSPTWATFNPMTTVGDVIIGGASGAMTRLAATTNGFVLTLVGGIPAWSAATGGMTNPMSEVGDIIIGGTAGAATRLPATTNGYVLTLVSGSPAWAAATGGGGGTVIQGGSSTKIQLDWSANTDIANGVAVGTSWVDVVTQTFTVDDSASEIEVSVAGYIYFGNAAVGTNGQARLLVDGTTSKGISGTHVPASNQGGNLLSGSSPAVLSLAAGTHTVKLQAISDATGAVIYCLPVSQPNAYNLEIRVLERKSTMNTSAAPITGASVTRTAALTLGNNSTVNVTWDTVEYNMGSQWDASQPTRLTCTLAGKYLCGASIELGSTGSVANLQLLLNGVLVSLHQDDAAGGNTALQTERVLDLKVGDYIQAAVYSSGATTLNVGSSKNNYLQMNALGGIVSGTAQNKVQLDYAFSGTYGNYTTGTTVTATTWTDLFSDQSFTVDDANSMVTFEAAAGLQMRATGHVSASLLIDGTTRHVLGTGWSVNNYFNPFVGSRPIEVSGLSAGTHTARLQLYCDGSSGVVICDPAAYPNNDFIKLKVIERKLVPASPSYANVNKVQLDYTLSSDISAVAGTVGAWVDTGISGTFTVDDPNSLVEFMVDAMGFVTSSSTQEHGTRLVIDGSINKQLGGGYTYVAGNQYNAFAGAGTIPISGLAAGSHTWKIQFTTSSAGNFYCRASSGAPSEYFGMRVVERKLVNTGTGGTLDQVRVTHSSPPAITAATETALAFDTNDTTFTSNAAMHSTSSNTTRLVAQTPGRYRVWASIESAANPGTSYAYFRKNGTGALNTAGIGASLSPPPATGGASICNPHGDIYLNATDYLEAVYYSGSGTTPQWQTFGMERIDGYAINPMTQPQDMIVGGTGGVPTRLPTIRGRVNSDGTIGSGSGFTTSRVAAGQYRVAFGSAMPSIPYVFAQAQIGTEFSAARSTWVSNVTVNGFSCEIANAANADVDNAFSFMVLGQ